MYSWLQKRLLQRTDRQRYLLRSLALLIVWTVFKEAEADASRLLTNTKIIPNRLHSFNIKTLSNFLIFIIEHRHYNWFCHKRGVYQFCSKVMENRFDNRIKFLGPVGDCRARQRGPSYVWWTPLKKVHFSVPTAEFNFSFALKVFFFFF